MTSHPRTLLLALSLLLAVAILLPLPALAAPPGQDPPAEPPTASEFIADTSATQPEFSALPDIALLPHVGEIDPPPAPLLLAPQDGEIVTGVSHPPLGLPTLKWAPVAVPAVYHIQLANNEGFTAPLISTLTPTATQRASTTLTRR